MIFPQSLPLFMRNRIIMLQYIESIKKVDVQNYTVDCLFHTETVVRRIRVNKLIDQYQNTPQIKELRQPEVFSQVSLDSYGTLVWGNGIDFCPDVLYELSEPIE